MIFVRHVIAATLVIACSISAHAQDQKPRPRIGVVNLERVYEKYALIADDTAEREKFLSPMRSEATVLKGEVVKLQQRLKSGDDKGSASTDIENRIIQNKRRLEELERVARKTIGPLMEAQQCILKKALADAIRTYCEQNDFDAVFGYGEAPKEYRDQWFRPDPLMTGRLPELLYVRPGADITQALIDHLNAQYREKRGSVEEGGSGD